MDFELEVIKGVKRHLFHNLSKQKALDDLNKARINCGGNTITYTWRVLYGGGLCGLIAKSHLDDVNSYMVVRQCRSRIKTYTADDHIAYYLILCIIAQIHPSTNQFKDPAMHLEKLQHYNIGGLRVLIDHLFMAMALLVAEDNNGIKAILALWLTENELENKKHFKFMRYMVKAVHSFVQHTTRKGVRTVMSDVQMSSMCRIALQQVVMTSLHIHHCVYDEGAAKQIVEDNKRLSSDAGDLKKQVFLLQSKVADLEQSKISREIEWATFMSATLQELRDNREKLKRVLQDGDDTYAKKAKEI